MHNKANDQVLFKDIASENFSFDLAAAKIPKQNIMTALACLFLLARAKKATNPFLLPRNKLQKLIASVSMPGRLQTILHSPKIILDVAHNRAAADSLVKLLKQTFLATEKNIFQLNNFLRKNFFSEFSMFGLYNMYLHIY